MATTDQKDLSIQMVHIDDQKDVHQLYPKTKDKNVTVESTNKALPTGISSLKDLVDKLGDTAFTSSTVIGITTDERNKLKGIEEGAQVNMVDGVKGDAETYYRTGDINITKANIGLGSVENKSSATIRSEITSQNVTSALGYTPPKQDTTYNDATTKVHGLMSTDDKVKLDGIAPGAQVNSITGVKGDNETTYRTGNVNITKANIGLTNVEDKSSATIRGELTSKNVTDALGYVPPRVNTTYEEATTTTDGLLSSEDKTKLDSIESGAQKNTVTGVKGYNESAYRRGDIVITKANIGLTNVEDKSSATIRGELTSKNVTDALGYTPPKQDTTYPPANGSTLGLIKTGGSLTLTSGVATVNDNSHKHTIANITNLQSSLDSKLNTSLKGAKNGLAELDENGLVPSTQLPSYVDDVIEVNMGSDLTSATLADDSPVTPEAGKIYVDLASNKTYRWSGTTFVVISDTIALGETSTTAFDGARGKIAYNHSQSAHARVDATLTQASTTNGNIKINGTETKVYTHPGYTAQKSGLYKVTVDGNGHVSAVSAVTKADITALGIPGQDTNTTYVAATSTANGLMSSSDKAKLDGIASGANAYTHPGYTSRTSGLYKITVDSLGHVSAVSSVTKADITGLGIPGSDTTYSTMKGATTDADGSKGLVPAPSKGSNTRYLRSDGTWVTPPNTTYPNASSSVNGLMSASDKAKLDGIASGANKYTHPSYTAYDSGFYKVSVDSTGHVAAAVAVSKSDITSLGIPGQDTTYADATTSAHGLMTAAMVSKLNGIASGANAYSHPTYSSHASGLYKVTVDGTGHVSAVASVTKSDIAALGIPSSDTTYGLMKGATTDADGSTGLVPAPTKGNSSRYLRSDGTWVTPPNTTYGMASSTSNGLMSSTDKAKLDTIASGANNYTHPSYTSRTSGLYKITVDGTGHVSAVASVTKSDITALGIPGQDTNTTYGTMVGASSSANGSTGLVPAPAKGDSSRYLRSDGTWVTPPNTTYNDATTSTHGLMSSTDKAKLNGIASGAQVNTVNSVAGKTGAVTLSKSDVGLGNVDNTADSAKSVKYAATAGSANSVAWNNVSGKPSTFTPSSHTHTIAQVTNLQSTLDGVDNKINSLNYKHITLDGGNTANYPYHRFLSIQNLTSTYYDCIGIYLIDRRVNGGGYGIIKVALRINDKASNYSVSAEWLVRTSQLALADVSYGAYVHDNKLDVDVFMKCAQWPRTHIYNILGSLNWAMLNSVESENTTTTDRLQSVECYSSLADAGTKIHSAAYSRTGNSIDDGCVASANSVAWGNVTGKPSTYYTHPGYTAHSSGLYKVTVDGSGHVSAVSNVTKSDITALGIPGQDTNTTYDVVSSSSNGLMSPTMLNTLNSVNSAIGGKYSSSGGTLNGDITFPAIGDTGSSKGINWSGSTDGARIYYKATAKDAGHLVFQASDDSDAVIDFEWNIGGTVSRKSYISSDGVYHGTASWANGVNWDNVSGKPSTYYTHPGYTAHSSGLYKVTVDGSGHVSAVSNVTKADITALGIPGADTNTWRGIQDNLTSTAKDQSLSANQGKILKSLVDGKAAANHTHPYISTSVNYVLITDETNLTAYDASSAKWNAPS